MSALAIVDQLNVLKDRRPRLIPSLERAVMDPLVLQRTEKALRHRIIVTVAPPAHTRRPSRVFSGSRHRPCWSTAGPDRYDGSARVLACIAGSPY